jgi:hypothetical protein
VSWYSLADTYTALQPHTSHSQEQGHFRSTEDRLKSNCICEHPSSEKNRLALGACSVKLFAIAFRRLFSIFEQVILREVLTTGEVSIAKIFSQSKTTQSAA